MDCASCALAQRRMLDRLLELPISSTSITPTTGSSRSSLLRRRWLRGYWNRKRLLLGLCGAFTGRAASLGRCGIHFITGGASTSWNMLVLMTMETREVNSSRAVRRTCIHTHACIYVHICLNPYARLFIYPPCAPPIGTVPFMHSSTVG